MSTFPSKKAPIYVAIVNSPDGTAVQTQPAAKLVTIANAVAITDIAGRFFNLITNGNMTEEEIRRYRNFKISIVNSHNQPANITLYTAVRALDTITASNGGIIYQETGILAASPGRLILQEKAAGTGAAATVKSVPALSSVHSNLLIQVQFSTAPTSGSITVVIEMN